MDELTLPDGTKMFHLHRGECTFLYQEIFVRKCYAGDGLTFDPGSPGCILDVGANIGMAAYFFHTQCPGKRIFAFEPSPKTFQVLAANVKRLRIDAKLYECALSSSRGSTLLTHYPNKSTMSGLYAEPDADHRTTKAYMLNEGVRSDDADFMLRGAFKPERLTCKLETISAIIEENRIEAIDLLKIDVEKAEWDVLRGIRDEHWPIVRQVAVEVHDIGGRVDATKRLFEGHGLRCVVKQDPKLTNTDLFDLVAVRP